MHQLYASQANFAAAWNGCPFPELDQCCSMRGETLLEAVPGLLDEGRQSNRAPAGENTLHRGLLKVHDCQKFC